METIYAVIDQIETSPMWTRFVVIATLFGFLLIVIQFFQIKGVRSALGATIAFTKLPIQIMVGILLGFGCLAALSASGAGPFTEIFGPDCSRFPEDARCDTGSGIADGPLEQFVVEPGAEVEPENEPGLEVVPPLSPDYEWPEYVGPPKDLRPEIAREEKLAVDASPIIFGLLPTDEQGAGNAPDNLSKQAKKAQLNDPKPTGNSDRSGGFEEGRDCATILFALPDNKAPITNWSYDNLGE